MLRRSLIKSSLISLAASACPVVWAQNRASNSWRVGRVLPLTGSQISYGEAKRDGGDAFVAAANAKGGIAGKQMELITVDDAYLEARTAESIIQLAQTQSPIAFSGFFGAPHCAAAAKVLAEMKQVGVGFTTGSNSFRTKPQREVFPVRASFVQETTAIIKHHKTTGIQEAVIAFVNIPFGQLAKASFEAAAGAEKLRLLPAVEIKADGSNIKEAALALQKTNVVLMALHTPSAMALVQGLRDLGQGQQVWCLSAVDTEIMLSKLKKAARGVSTSLVVPAISKTATPVVREYLAATSAIKKPATSYGLEAFIEMKTLALGLAKTKANEPQALIAALEAVGKADLGGFEVQYAPDVRTGSRFVDLAIISDQRVMS
jgi:branched-chain amino acid transport system substrate-binding protein